jgi:hypothetical protein
MQPTPVYTTIAHADVTEDGRVWRYSVVIRYLAAWYETYEDGEVCPHAADNYLCLYRLPADETLRPGIHDDRSVNVWLDNEENQATVGDITGEDWDCLFTAASNVWPQWPTFDDVALYPQMVRLIVRLLQEAGVP